MSHRPAALDLLERYRLELMTQLAQADLSAITALAEALETCRRHKRHVYLCGNGGSAANALHMVNDLMYGAATPERGAVRATALPANVSLLTCLANDVGYAEVFSQPLSVLAQPGDVLIVLSGSGNSPNIVRALEQARVQGLTSFAILGYSGGKALTLADHALHFPLNDMQIAEDLQLIVGHMVMRLLCSHVLPEGES